VKLLACAVSSVIAGITAVQTSYAQDEQLEEIVVTGSRIRRQDYNSANPVATLDASELDNLGIINAGDALQLMPSNVTSFTPETTGGSAFQVGGNLPDLRGLNPFFGTRTMTLVNTRRHVSTNQGGSVDLNFIPSVMIGRIETVTGGASASYGADAISGVVNIILDTNFEGIKFEADYGVTGEGDGDNKHAGFAFGTAFADGRGHFLIGGEIENQDRIQDCSTARDFCAEGNGFFTNGTGGGSTASPDTTFVPRMPGQPYNVQVTNQRGQSSPYGTVWSNVQGNQIYRFNEQGTDIVPFDAGQYYWLSQTGNVIGGEGPSVNDNLTLMPQIERETFMLNTSWDFTDTMTGFVEASYGTVTAVNLQHSPGQNSATVCVMPTNPYLMMGSAAMQAAVAQSRLEGAGCSNVASFAPGTNIAKDWRSETDQRVDTDTTVKRLAFGLNGTVFGDWEWDAYYQWGNTERSQIGDDYRTNHRWNMAFDTEINPLTNEIDCRVNIYGAIPFFTLPLGADPSLAQGCQPMNPFGVDNNTQAALDYAYGSLTEFNDITLKAGAFNINGELWGGWGYGPLNAAFGIEYRTEDFVNDAGPLPKAQRTDFGLQYGDEFAGNLKALEYFGEFEMPLLADMALVKELTANLAVRRSEYDTQGGILNASGSTSMDTWKLSAVWDINDWLRIRGSHSKDARAPTYRELYYSQTIPSGGWFGVVTNPWRPDGDQRDETEIVLAGNVDLVPEEADTNTIGFVLTPTEWLEGFQFSMDYYEIDLTGGIQLGVNGSSLNNCFDLNLECEYLTFGDPNIPGNDKSNIIKSTTLYGNGNPYNSSGIDFAASYTFPASNLMDSIPGDISLRLLSTKSLETIVRAAGRSRDISGQVGGSTGFLPDYSPSPEWSSNVIMTYMNGPATVTMQARIIGSGRLDKETPKIGPGDPGYDVTHVNTSTIAELGTYTMWNLNGSWTFEDIGKGLNIYASINNLFDKQPPFSAGGVGGVNTRFYDAMGRIFRFGVRAQY
jgi:outer membrane receptor protein involved in Fe transport